jgi:Ca2+/Na+ antiporter
MIYIWLQFGICAAIITVAGSKLSNYGNLIAEKSGLGDTVVGLVLLATVTSLAELITGISAVTVTDLPDLAVGAVLGSCVFNLALLVILDFLYRGESVYSKAHQGHVLAAGFGIVLIGFTGFSVLGSSAGILPTLAHIGLYTPVILVTYLPAMRTVFYSERVQRARDFGHDHDRRVHCWTGLSGQNALSQDSRLGQPDSVLCVSDQFLRPVHIWRVVKRAMTTTHLTMACTGRISEATCVVRYNLPLTSSHARAGIVNTSARAARGSVLRNSYWLTKNSNDRIHKIEEMVDFPLRHGGGRGMAAAEFARG